MTAPIPVPQYISLENVQPLIGVNLVLFSDTDPDGIDPATANMLISQGEQVALTDLFPYFITEPSIISNTGGDWTTLPYQTYNFIYYMFVSLSASKLIGAFLAKNTDDRSIELSRFEKHYWDEYQSQVTRLRHKLPNGAYSFQLPGIQVNPNGIPRIPRTYMRVGNLGTPDYTDSQVINPSRNFNGLWPMRIWWR